MGELKTIARPFSSKGLALKSDQALLQPDEYIELTNLVSSIEGSLSPRRGDQRLTAQGSFTSNGGSIHSITSLATSGTANVPKRVYYIGMDGVILCCGSGLPVSGANMAFNQRALGATAGAPYTAQRFSAVSGNAQNTGAAFKYFACPKGMYKDNGTQNLWPWGIIPPTYPAAANVSNTGIAANSFSGAQVPYTYVYTYYNATTGGESNPSLVFLTNGVTPNGSSIAVHIQNSPDSQVTEVRIYRAGGTFADSLYRYVGSLPLGAGLVFYDQQQDSAIAGNNVAQFDNDPPVPSTLPVPFKAQIGAYITGTGGVGFNSFTPSNITGATLSQLTKGSLITFTNVSTNATETCRLINVDATNNTMSVYFQLDHTGATLKMEVDSIVAGPASIACAFQDAIYVAGDANNPNALYRSKSSLPESFPVLDLTSNVSLAITVGDPGDPIVGVIDYNGEIVVIKQSSIYGVSVFNGIMNSPVRTPAKRGAVNRAAWCRVSNEIWYVSRDGIFAFSGGAEVWKSAAIDPLFTPPTSGAPWPYPAIDMRPGLGTAGSDVIQMECSGHEVFVSYLDTNGVSWRLRYHTQLDRWSIEQKWDALAAGNSPFAITCEWYEQDTSNFFIGKQIGAQGYLCLDVTGTSDGWVNVPTDGAPIPFAATPGWMAQPVAIDKLFSDASLDYTAGSPLTINTFYGFQTTPDAIDAFTAPVTVGRSRFPFSFRQSQGFVSQAMTLRISGTTTSPCVLNSLTSNYWELAQYRDGLSFDWDTLGYEDEKTLRWIEIEIDTGGVPASLQIQGDGLNLLTTPISITTTALDRRRTIGLPSNLTARTFRPVITPGIGGKTNYFAHRFEFVREPALLQIWDSYQWSPWDGYTFIKQMWLQYSSSTPVTVTVFSDNNSQFFSIVLPAQPLPLRDTQRFYLPSIVGNVLNKSKSHRIIITSASGFRLYKDASGIEWLPCGADQRGGYQQQPLSQVLAPQVA